MIIINRCIVLILKGALHSDYNCIRLTHANHLETLTTVNSTPSQSIETCTVVLLIHSVIITIPTLSLSTVGGTM